MPGTKYLHVLHQLISLATLWKEVILSTLQEVLISSHFRKWREDDSKSLNNLTKSNEVELEFNVGQLDSTQSIILLLENQF